MSLDSGDDKNSCSFHCVERGTTTTRFVVCGPIICENWLDTQILFITLKKYLQEEINKK